MADNVVSRKSHYAHEGKKSEYAQGTELYRRVMDDKAREATHRNTAKMMARVNYPIIQVNWHSLLFFHVLGHATLLNATTLQKKYLAQIYNIAPEYPKAVYDLLPKKEFSFSEVEALSKTAHEFYKEPKFRPGEDDRLVGYAPQTSIYNV